MEECLQALQRACMARECLQASVGVNGQHSVYDERPTGRPMVLYI